MKERDNYWDIVKGIGIVSIVIGHTCMNVSPFVYTYHLVIIFFVGAWFYNSDRYGMKPFQNMGRVLKGTYLKYIGYTWILILLHNFCIRFMLYNDTVYYSISDMVIRMCNAFTFQNSELFGGALWFVPVYTFVISLLGFAVYYSKRISQRIVSVGIIKKSRTSDWLELLILLIITGLIGYIGVYYNLLPMEMAYHIHTGLVVFSVCTLAYILKKKNVDIKKICKGIGVIPAAGILYICVYKMGMQIELSKEQIINGYMFYIVSIIGIIFCFCLANIIEKVKLINSIFALMGRYSFSIMAMHFFVVKCIDRAYAYKIGETDRTVISQWVTTYADQMWPFYIILGSILPAVIFWGCDKVKNKVFVKIEE